VTTSAPFSAASGLAARAATAPHAVALHDRDRSLTLEELAGLAGTTARMLAERCGPGSDERPPIPVIVERDVDALVAVHAAMRAGLAFAPIDPALPPAAVDALLARLGRPPVVLGTRPEHRRLVPADTDVLTVATTVDDPLPPQPVEPNDRALVLFTSGSTGHPKGVVIEWWMLATKHQSPRRLRRNTAGLHLPNLAPFHWTAGLGSALDVADGVQVGIIDASLLDPVELLELIDHHRFDQLAMVPSLALQVLDRWPDGRRLESVRRLESYGEALTWEHVPAMRRLVHVDASIATMYGSSEGVHGALGLTIGPDTPLGRGRVPVGFPNEPGRVRVEPMGDAPDAPREIVITGAVAREYLGDPELTAARFGVDADGTRWWRSGDLAEIDADGAYHLIGRVDDLVKIRGRLVEPAEPERVLHELPGIRQAVVLAHTTRGGATRLVGHVELEAAATLTPRQVNARLREHLAPHLVPRPLVRHDRLPRTRTGKVDRVRLLAEPLAPWTDAPARRVHDDIERAVAAIAAEILELDQVHPDDDLWELGLDSLAAVELVAACSELGFGELEPTASLEHPSAAALAALLRSGAPERTSIAVVLNPDGVRPPLHCIPGGGGTALAFHWLARALGDDQPVVVIEAQGLHTPGRPDRTIHAAAMRAVHEIEHRQPEGRLVVAGHSAAGAIAVEAARELARRGRAVHAVLLDTPAPAPDGARGRSRRERISAHLAGRTVPEVLRATVRRAHAERIAVHPGRPTRVTSVRYRAFTLITARALRRHRTVPVTFPVTLLHTAEMRHPDRWHGLAGELDLRLVEGDHLTMLQPPHATGLADQLAAVLDPGLGTTAPEPART